MKIFLDLIKSTISSNDLDDSEHRWIAAYLFENYRDCFDSLIIELFENLNFEFKIAFLDSYDRQEKYKNATLVNKNSAVPNEIKFLFAKDSCLEDNHWFLFELMRYTNSYELEMYFYTYQKDYIIKRTMTG